MGFRFKYQTEKDKKVFEKYDDQYFSLFSFVDYKLNFYERGGEVFMSMKEKVK